MSTLYQSLVDTPLGKVRVVSTDTAVVEVAFADEQALTEGPENDLSRTAKAQLEAYFAGHRRQFDLPLAPRGTEFQRQAWLALRQIPYGETRSYTEQAGHIKRPTAVRAIGAANGANPIAVIVPCHRVIGKNGALIGYAGGLNRKEWLLAFERELAGETEKL